MAAQMMTMGLMNLTQAGVEGLMGCGPASHPIMHFLPQHDGAPG